MSSPALLQTLTERRHVSNTTAVQQCSISSGFQTIGRIAWRRQRDGRLELRHDLDLHSVSDGQIVSGLERLVAEGVVSGQQQFEDAAIGLILTCANDPDLCWRAFYDNSMAELESGRSAFSPVHRRALSLLTGQSVLEVGSCFGFFALRAAKAGFEVSACDISSGAVNLLNRAAGRVRLPVEARKADALALPYADSSVDTVTLIHLLEHLPDRVEKAIGEAMRVARRQVVIAVPYEDVPSPHFGHHQRLTPETLVGWAEYADHHGARIFSDHGGWLVLRTSDRGAPRRRSAQSCTATPTSATTSPARLQGEGH